MTNVVFIKRERKELLKIPFHVNAEKIKYLN